MKKIISMIVLGGNFITANATQISDPSQGRLLYSIYCISCHIKQNNWANKSNATNWTALRAEVRRWTRLSPHEMREDEPTAVAKYLNNFVLYCNYPLTK